MAFKVLIIDDSMTTRVFIEKALRLSGEVDECYHAGNGMDGLLALKLNWIDFVIVDLNMPRMTGREFLKTVRKDPQWKAIPIAVITSEQSDETRAEVLKLGANLLCLKPLLPADARNLIDQLKGQPT
jgi:two-component system chemotaxis response regulator CheY